MTTYPTIPDRTVTRSTIDARDVQARLSDEFGRLNDALEARFEDMRHLRRELAVQTARADHAEATLRAGNERVAAMERRIREAGEVIAALVPVADRCNYVDGVLLRMCCDSEAAEPHKPGCPVRAAEEWLK